MPTFTDDFNRADGGLGDNWDQTPGGGGISGNHAYGVGGVSGRCVVDMGTARQSVSMVVYKGSGVPNRADVCVKVNDGFSQYYSATTFYSSGLYYFAIHKEAPGISMNLELVEIPNTGSGTHTYTIEYDGGFISASYDGTTTLEAADDDLAANQYVGFNLNAGDIWGDDFAADYGALQSMVVEPDPLWIGGGPCLVTATGTGTEWTGGGSPSTTFSVDHGEITTQTWISATEFELILDPADYLGTLTFSETQYGLEAQLETTALPPDTGTNGICQLTPAGATVLNRAGTITPDGAVLTTDTTLGSAFPGDPDLTVLDAFADLLTGFYVYHIPGQTLTLGEALDKIWVALNGHLDFEEGTYPTQPAQPINVTLGDFYQLFYNEDTTEYVHATDILDAIDDISAPDLTAIRNDIGINGQETWASLLSVLLAMWGEGGSTIETISTDIGTIRTASLYTLGSVIDAIGDIPQYDGQNVLDAIAALDTVVDTGVSNIRSDIAASTLLIVGLGTDLGNLASLTSALSEEVDTLSDKIDALAAALDLRAPPIWPGEDNVTLGTPVALTSQLHLTGAMDGVIVAITTPPTRTGLYEVGGAPLDYGQGRIAFETDDGDIEPWQYLGFRSAIYTPKSMAHAAGVRFQMLAGAAGTVTPWTVSA